MKIHSKSNKILNLSIFLILGTISTFGILKIIEKAWAVKATDFNAGRIIDDEIFYNKDAMSADQIQAFLNEQIGNCDTWGTQRATDKGRGDITNAQYAKQTWGIDPPFACINNYHENPTTKETSFERGGGAFEGGISAAQIIYRAAQEYGINPQVLLVMLKKESLGVLNDTWPIKSQYKYSMGYACPDSGPGFTAACADSKAGFYNQMSLAAWQLKYYKEHANDYSLHLGWNDILYNPNPACGTKRVNIENVATLSLYIYTPYTPNDGALASYPRAADCGAYGNRNFFMFFNQLFGSTLVGEKAQPAIKSNIEVSAEDFNVLTPANLAIDVAGGSFSNGSQIQIYSQNETPAQRFTFEKTSDGFYVIRSRNGTVLDLSGGSIKNGSKIQIWNYNGTCAQKWSLIRKDNGRYKILSACSGNKALDIDGGQISRLGTKIQLWEDNNSAAQEFELSEKGESYFTNDNAYSLSSISGKYLTANFTISNNNKAEFKISKQKDGFYKISGAKYGLLLTEENDSLSFSQANNTKEQLWIFEKNDNYFEVKNASSGKSLDISGGLVNSEGRAVQLYESNSSDAQKWAITSSAKTQAKNTEDNLGNKNITVLTPANLAIDVAGGSFSNGSQIQIYSQNETPAQRFTFEKTSDGFYVIRSRNGTVLDLSGGSIKNGSKIQIWNYNGTCAQKWSLIRKDNGRYKILSACSGNKALDIDGGQISRLGTKIQLWEDNNSAAQEFELVEK